MSTKKLMAEFIYDSGAECCSACAYTGQCTERARERESKNEFFELPKKEYCVNGIISFFEKQSFLDRMKNDKK